MEDGWGLATDGKCLYGTDGSSTLYHIDPLNMKGFGQNKKFSFSSQTGMCAGGGGGSVEEIVNSRIMPRKTS